MIVKISREMILPVIYRNLFQSDIERFPWLIELKHGALSIIAPVTILSCADLIVKPSHTAYFKYSGIYTTYVVLLAISHHKFYTLYTLASLCSIHFHFDRSTVSTKNAGVTFFDGTNCVRIWRAYESLRTCVKSFPAAAGKIDRSSIRLW